MEPIGAKWGPVQLSKASGSIDDYVDVDDDRDDDGLLASIVDRRLVEASGALLPFSHLTSTHCIY